MQAYFYTIPAIYIPIIDLYTYNTHWNKVCCITVWIVALVSTSSHINLHWSNSTKLLKLWPEDKSTVCQTISIATVDWGGRGVVSLDHGWLKSNKHMWLYITYVQQ